MLSANRGGEEATKSSLGWSGETYGAVQDSQEFPFVLLFLELSRDFGCEQIKVTTTCSDGATKSRTSDIKIQIEPRKVGWRTRKRFYLRVARLVDKCFWLLESAMQIHMDLSS